MGSVLAATMRPSWATFPIKSPPVNWLKPSGRIKIGVATVMCSDSGGKYHVYLSTNIKDPRLNH